MHLSLSAFPCVSVCVCAWVMEGANLLAVRTGAGLRNCFFFTSLAGEAEVYDTGSRGLGLCYTGLRSHWLASVLPGDRPTALLGQIRAFFFGIMYLR